jgi:putative transcription antitermination factor YqgF
MNSPILALDIGLRRTGVALSESGLLAKPLDTIEWQPPHAHRLIEAIIQLIEQYEVQTLIVGIPLTEESETTEQAQKTAALVIQIQAALQEKQRVVDIIEVNEYHSTKDAAVLFPDLDKDAAAALLLLQEQLEEKESW